MKRHPPAATEEMSYAPRLVICPIDLDEGGHAGVRSAVSVAAHAGARLRLLHVLDTPPPVTLEAGQSLADTLGESWEAREDAVASRLESVVAQQASGVSAETEVRIGTPHHEICAAATDDGAHLIAMASRGRHGVEQHLLGSIAERVVRLAPCPVLTVPASSDGFAPQRVIVATDMSRCADLALPVARFITLAYAANVTLLHVLPPRSHPGVLPDVGPPPTMTDDYWNELREAAREDLESRIPLLTGPNGRVTARLVSAGDPGEKIVALAAEQQADLIITGTHGHTGLQRLLLGSTAEKIVRRAACAVLTVNPRFFTGELSVGPSPEQYERAPLPTPAPAG